MLQFMSTAVKVGVYWIVIRVLVFFLHVANGLITLMSKLGKDGTSTEDTQKVKDLISECQNIERQ